MTAVISTGRFASGLLDRARAYLRAFNKIDCKGEPQLIYPAYQLLALSCELGLKAFLSAKGWSQDQLVRLRHDLPKLHKKARSEGLGEVVLLETLVSILARANEQNLLRYPTLNIASIPEPEECGAVVSQLLTAIRPVVLEAFLDSLVETASN